jgi:hypothetical protein
MNEKIKALAKQAGWNPARPPYGKFSQYDEFDHDKFAELIVRECDRYARSAWEHGDLLGRDLLIHFGVEE